MNAATIISKKKRTINLTSVEDYNSGNSLYFVDFHPNGNFIAASGNITNKQVIIYSWNGSTTVAEVETVDTGTGTGAKWHPNGNYLAIREYNDATNSVYVDSWNGTDTLALASNVIGVTGGASDISWHPSGNYIAATTYKTSESIKVYSWNGTNTLAEVETLNTGVAAYSCCWSHDGNYLAVSHPLNLKGLTVYSWNGTDTLTEVAAYSYGTTTFSYDPRWSSDDAYIFTGCGIVTTVAEVWAFAFDGSSLTLKDSESYAANEYCRGLDVYNDKYIAAAKTYVSGTTSLVGINLYGFSKATETFTLVDTYTIAASSYGVNLPRFNANGTYIACPMNIETGNSIRMLKVYE